MKVRSSIKKICASCQIVTVCLGHDNDEGKLRICVLAGGDHIIRKGPAGSFLMLPAWAGIAAGKQEATAITKFIANDQLCDIALPQWARG